MYTESKRQAERMRGIFEGIYLNGWPGGTEIRILRDKSHCSYMHFQLNFISDAGILLLCLKKYDKLQTTNTATITDMTNIYYVVFER